MSYAVKIGTTSAMWIDDAPTHDGYVRYDGPVSDGMVWDDQIQNIRPALEGEIRPVILPVTAAQFRLALLELGLLDEVETFVAAASREIQLNWEYRLEFERDHPLVIGVGMALGKTDAEIDAVFQLARGK